MNTLTEKVEIVYKDTQLKVGRSYPKGTTPLKKLPNGLVEDSRGRKYYYAEDGSLRRLK